MIVVVIRASILFSQCIEISFNFTALIRVPSVRISLEFNRFCAPYGSWFQKTSCGFPDLHRAFKILFMNHRLKSPQIYSAFLCASELIQASHPSFPSSYKNRGRSILGSLWISISENLIRLFWSHPSLQNTPYETLSQKFTNLIRHCLKSLYKLFGSEYCLWITVSKVCKPHSTFPISSELAEYHLWNLYVRKPYLTFLI